MPREIDERLPCGGWGVRCKGVGAVGVGERRGTSWGLLAENDHSKGSSSNPREISLHQHVAQLISSKNGLQYDSNAK